METVEAVRYVVDGVFLLLTAVGLRVWRRSRTVPAAWAASMFGSIALVVLGGHLWPDVPPRLVTVVLVVLLLAFPYLLFRFADSMNPVAAPLRLTAVAAVAVIAVPALFIDPMPDSASTPPAIYTSWVLAVTVVWLGLSLIAAWQLYSPGRGRPQIVRSRMRLMAAAALTMGLAVPIRAAVRESAENTGVDLLVNGLVILAGILFLLAFAPPPFLRTLWRSRAERRLYHASVSLMAAREPQEVIESLLPGARDLLGARGVAAYDADGHLVAAVGVRPGLHDGHAEVLDLHEHRIAIATDFATPLFGDEEAAMLQRLRLLADLALDRTRLLAAEQEARQTLQEANEELEAFLYTASHDLKNPLIAVTSYLDLLHDEHLDELPAEAQHYLQRALVNADFMQALIRDLLDLARIGRADLQPDRVETGSLLEELAREVRQAHPGFTVEASGLPDLWLNPTRARQLFANLLHNAASHAGRSDVTVTVTWQAQSDGTVVIRVSDNGRGIPDAHLERVFGIFERLDHEQARDGTGIGLAICRRIAVAAGGDLRAVPSDDGATFDLHLPAEVVYPAEAMDHPEAVDPAGTVDPAAPVDPAEAVRPASPISSPQAVTAEEARP